MKTLKWTVLVNIGMISLLAVSTSGCSILANALRGDVSPSPPTVSPTSDPPSIEPIPSRTPPQTKADALRQMNCSKPSKTDYISGTYQVGWTAKGDRYEGILQMNGDVGEMRLKFFNSVVNSEDSVAQDMVLASCPQGLILLGVNPRVPNTSKQHPTYVADNIIIRRETNGVITLVMIDDRGVVAPLEIQEISN